MTPVSLDYGTRGQVLVHPDAEALAVAAAETFVRATTDAVAARGLAFVLLSGGSTPKRMGQLLATNAFRLRAPWESIELFWGDERWVPLDSPESNAGEAKRTFIDHVPIPASRVNPFPVEGPDPQSAAKIYESTLRTVFGATEGLPRFDLIMLGMGDDGHTASLFPGTAAIQEGQAMVVAHHVPKLDAIRLTLTPPVLNAAREIVFVAGGAGKAETLRRVLEEPERHHDLPSQIIRPTDGTLTWLIDDAAAANLTNVYSETANG